MTDALPSFDNEAMYEAPTCEPRDASTWLGRRAYHFGASEAHALLVICGKRSADTAPRWMIDEAIKETRTRFGSVPMLLARKAGLRRATRRNALMQAGIDREQELLERFRAEHAASLMIDPASITHGSVVPREWFPLCDRQCRELASSPDDGWGRDMIDGSLVVLEEKCSYESYEHKYGGLPEYYRSQLVVRMGCEGASRSVLIEGVRWSNNRVPDGPVVPYEAQPDEALLHEIRSCARDLWTEVERLRARRGEQ